MGQNAGFWADKESTIPMVLDEYIDNKGMHQCIYLSSLGDSFFISHVNDKKELNPKSLPLLFRKFGYELDPTIEHTEEGFQVADWGTLYKLRYKSPVDADLRNYLVWKTSDSPPQVGLARQISSGLCYLSSLVVDHSYYK